MPRVWIAVAFVAGLSSTSAWAAPCAGFTDVDDTSPFCADVSWIKNRGITLGCTATAYCPADNVTRLQMAIFMRRLGESLFPVNCANGQVMKWNGSAWACAADAAGSGTVTSVTAGTGIATTPAGGIVASGSVRIADGGVGSQQLADNAVTFNKIAPGNIGAVHVNPGQIQLRVAALCPRGVPLIGVAADGSPICDNPAAMLPFSTARVSVALRGDGRPLAARDGGNLYDCADVDCTSGTGINLNLGGDVAMALRSDGRPVIAVGNSFSQLLVICGDATCTPGSRITRTLDNGSIGTFSMIALRADNTPLVAYFEFGSGQTRLYVCGDPSCASGAIRTITASPSATPSSLKIRPNGTPVISLRDYFGGGHSLYDCNDASCSSGTQRGLGAGVSIRFLLGMAVRADNRPIVANTGPVLHDCDDAACSTNTLRPFDVQGSFLAASAIAIRSDGRPIVAYGLGGTVKLFDCANVQCTSGTARTVDVVDTSFSDQEIALALRSDDRPVLAYPAGPGQLRVLSCRTATCQ